MTGWRADAACRGINPDLFYPVKGDVAGSKAARAVCASCPVAGECLDEAIATNERDGIWGGATERQRRETRQARGRLDRLASHGTDSRWATGCDCSACAHAYERLVLEARATLPGSGTRQRKVRVERGRRLSTGTTAIGRTG